MCWPDRGAGPATAPGVAENSSSGPACRIRPTSGSSTSTTQPSARKASSASASPGERTVLMPSPAPAAASSHSAAGNFLKASVRRGWRKIPVSRPSGSIDTRSGSSR